MKKYYFILCATLFVQLIGFTVASIIEIVLPYGKFPLLSISVAIITCISSLSISIYLALKLYKKKKNRIIVIFATPTNYMLPILFALGAFLIHTLIRI